MGKAVRLDAYVKVINFPHRVKLLCKYAPVLTVQICHYVDNELLTQYAICQLPINSHLGCAVFVNSHAVRSVIFLYMTTKHPEILHMLSEVELPGGRIIKLFPSNITLWGLV